MKKDDSQTHRCACPLCGSDKPRRQPNYRKLYGHYVCRRCYYRFANRRQFAFLIDCILWILLFRFFAYGIDTALRVFHAPQDLIRVALNVLIWLHGATFLIKDGFRGVSPGKAAMGIYVIDETSGERAGRTVSSKRNLPLIVPFALFIIAFQLVRGYRWGDRWANTKVIWKRYKDKAPFAIETPDIMNERT
ncbi:MAG TPA: RDD family protein [bacterium]|nr:RDD family protein [bacterium]